MSATLLSLVLCLTLTAQEQDDVFFVQLADPQFGMFTDDRDFRQETTNYELVVENLNRLRPAFVVICGDLINKVGDPEQAAEYFRITSGLDSSIPVHAASGNHDVGSEPTPETLAAYRERFGPDYYSFEQAGVAGTVRRSAVARRSRGGSVAWVAHARRGRDPAKTRESLEMWSAWRRASLFSTPT